MEFLRFGSRISGAYIGCCGIDIIQNFKVDPDALASCQLVHGDSGVVLGNDGGRWLGPTYKEIFLSRLRISTFGLRNQPNHAFLASMTGTQLETENGKKWLAILKENGFEFIRAVDNSVYSGGDPKTSTRHRRPIYLFALFRNIGGAALEDPFAPPEEWTSLPECTKSQQELWDEGNTNILTEQQVRDAGAPVMLAGTKGEKPKEKVIEPTESPLLQPLESEPPVAA